MRGMAEFWAGNDARGSTDPRITPSRPGAVHANLLGPAPEPMQAEDPKRTGGRRHWLDPLARRLLIAAGQIAAPPPPAAESGGRSAAPPARDDAVERELLALRLKHRPGLRLADADQVRHAAALGWSLDVNRASAADWLRLPGIRLEEVDRLLLLQAAGVQLADAEELQARLRLERDRLNAWAPLLVFRCYAGPPEQPAPVPLPVNRASLRLLSEKLGLDAPLLRRLEGERRRRPFRDLGDLQRRLELSSARAEAWLGRLRFDADASGPELPPARRPPQ
jgi:hypothetical protein